MKIFRSQAVLQLFALSAIGLSIAGLGLFVFPEVEKEQQLGPFVTTSSSFAVDGFSELCARWRMDDAKVTISGEVKLTSIGTYQNVFQTDNLNDGLRLEISPTREVALVVGTLNSGDYTAIQLERINAFTQSFEFAVILHRDQIVIDINGVLVTERLATRAACSNFLVGQGYDNSRKILGNTQIQIEAKWKSPLLDREKSNLPLALQSVILLSATSYMMVGYLRKRET
jgi:hypothetical protein